MATDTVFARLQEIQRSWGLTHAQMAELLHVESERYSSWMEQADRDPELPTLLPGAENAAPLIAIHRRLSERLHGPEDQVQWLTRPHRDFDGNPPIQVARSSPENLAWLAYYLESALTLGLAVLQERDDAASRRPGTG